MLDTMDGDLLVELEAALKAGDHARAGTIVITHHGDELYGYLLAVAGETTADDVYSQLCEDVWRGLPGFSFRSSLRTWLYVLARNALHRHRRSPWNHRDRRTGDAALDAAIAVPHSRTAPWQRTEVKAQFRALREGLDIDDQTLLVLRVDRELPWRAIAEIMANDLVDDRADRGSDVVLDDKTLAKHAARLRKRFQHVKEELTARAIAAGVLASTTP